MSASSSKKRRSQPDSHSGPNKVAKLDNFFTKRSSNKSEQSMSKLTWLRSFAGPSGTSCLHAIHDNPKSSSKVAAFDLDDTLVVNHTARWWNAAVPTKLKEAISEGYAIVIFTNQGGLKSEAGTQKWMNQIKSLADANPDIPFRLFNAVGMDNFKYRKPNIAMWQELEDAFAEDDVKIDKSLSFFVGDAAGRHYPKRKDFSSSDRKFAFNIGIEFYSPEEYFLGKPKHPAGFTYDGLDVASLASDPLLKSPVPNPPSKEIVLFVGYPVVGKTTFFRKHFEPAGYRHIDLNTRAKCIKAIEEALSEGASCVVDSLNRDVITRKIYVEAAKKLGVPIRCLWFPATMELGWHNNMYQAYYSLSPPNKPVVPRDDFRKYREHFQAPTLEEGFVEVEKIEWAFEGTEEERKVWAKWYLLFGKDHERFL